MAISCIEVLILYLSMLQKLAPVADFCNRLKLTFYFFHYYLSTLQKNSRGAGFCNVGYLSTKLTLFT